MKLPVSFSFSQRSLLALSMLVLCGLAGTVSAASSSTDALQTKRWIHGSADCDSNKDPSFEIYAYSPSTYIFRQSKCLTYEAPFLYLLLGEERALLLDSGALKGEHADALRSQVRSLAGDRPLLLLHSHGHRDHILGDEAFSEDRNTEIIAPKLQQLSAFLGVYDWPNGQAVVDLGDRPLTVIPTPGHQEEALAVYDPKTGWLLTGDTIYPGAIYIKDWDSYRKSIARLSAFAETRMISALMGAHIEAKRGAREYYPVGATFQPEEAALPLGIQTLNDLHEVLAETPSPARVELNEMVLEPMNALQRMISNVSRRFSP